METNAALEKLRRISSNLDLGGSLQNKSPPTTTNDLMNPEGIITMSRRSSIILPVLSSTLGTTISETGQVTSVSALLEENSQSTTNLISTSSRYDDSTNNGGNSVELVPEDQLNDDMLEPSESINPTVRRALGLKTRKTSVTGLTTNDIEKESSSQVKLIEGSSTEDRDESLMITQSFENNGGIQLQETTQIATNNPPIYSSANNATSSFDSGSSHLTSSNNLPANNSATIKTVTSFTNRSTQHIEERVDAPIWFNGAQTPVVLVKKMNLHPFLGVEVVPVSVSTALMAPTSIIDEQRVNNKISPLVSVAQSIVESQSQDSHRHENLETQYNEEDGVSLMTIDSKQEIVQIVDFLVPDVNDSVPNDLSKLQKQSSPLTFTDMSMQKKGGNATIAMSLGSFSPYPRQSTTSPTRMDRERSPIPSSWPDMQVFSRNPNIIADEAVARHKDFPTTVRPATVYDRLTTSPKKPTTPSMVDNSLTGFKNLLPPASAASSILDPLFSLERGPSRADSMRSSQVIKPRPFVSTGRSSLTRPTTTIQQSSNARKVLSPSEWKDLANRLSSPQQKAKRESSQEKMTTDIDEPEMSNESSLNRSTHQLDTSSMSSRILNPYALENQLFQVQNAPSFPLSSLPVNQVNYIDLSSVPMTASSTSKRSRRSPSRRSREETVKKRAEKERLKEEQRNVAALAAAQGTPFSAFGAHLRLNTDVPNSPQAMFSFQFPSPSGGFMPISPTSQQVNIASLSPGFQARLAEITKNLSSPTGSVSQQVGNLSPSQSRNLLNPFGGPLELREAQTQTNSTESHSLEGNKDDVQTSIAKETEVFEEEENNSSIGIEKRDLVQESSDVSTLKSSTNEFIKHENVNKDIDDNKNDDNKNENLLHPQDIIVDTSSVVTSSLGKIEQIEDSTSSMSPTTSFYAKMISDQYKGLTERILASISGSPPNFSQTLDSGRSATISISSMYSSSRPSSLSTGGLVVAGVPAMTIRAYSRQGGSRLGSRSKSRSGRPSTVTSKHSMIAQAAYSQTQSLIESPSLQNRAISPGKEKRPLGSGLGIAIRPTFDPFAPANLLQEQDAFAPPSVRVQPSQLPNTLTLSSPEQSSRQSATQWLDKHSPSPPHSNVAASLSVSNQTAPSKSVSSDSPFLQYKSVLGVITKPTGIKTQGRVSGGSVTLKDFLARPLNENPDQFFNRTNQLIAAANGTPFVPSKLSLLNPSSVPSLKPKSLIGVRPSIISKPPRNVSRNISTSDHHEYRHTLQQDVSSLAPPVFFSSVSSNKPLVSKFASDLDEAASFAHSLLSGLPAFSPTSSMLLPRASTTSVYESLASNVNLNRKSGVDTQTLNRNTTLVQTTPALTNAIQEKTDNKEFPIIKESNSSKGSETPVSDSTLTDQISNRQGDSFSQFPAFTMSGPYIEGSTLDGDDEVLGLNSNGGSTIMMNRPNSRSVSLSQRGFSMLIPTYTPTRGSSPSDSPDKEGGADIDENSSRGEKSRPVTVPVEALAQLLASDVMDMNTVGDSRPNTSSRPNTQQRSGSRMTQHKASKAGNPYKTSVV